jgi:hypothetical protein
MELNWIVNYWLLEAGKGDGFIQYEDEKKTGYGP